MNHYNYDNFKKQWGGILMLMIRLWRTSHWFERKSQRENVWSDLKQFYHLQHITATCELIISFCSYEVAHAAIYSITYCSVVTHRSFFRLLAAAENQSWCSQPLIILWLQAQGKKKKITPTTVPRHTNTHKYTHCHNCQWCGRHCMQWNTSMPDISSNTSPYPWALSISELL